MEQILTPEKRLVSALDKINKYCEQFGAGNFGFMSPLPDGRYMVVKINKQDGSQEGILAFDRNGDLDEFSPEDAAEFVERLTNERVVNFRKVATSNKSASA